jgi:hypothetical protein
VFDAAMSLVQGKPTTANVEALLVSVLRLEDGKEQGAGERCDAEGGRDGHDRPSSEAAGAEQAVGTGCRSVGK